MVALPAQNSTCKVNFLVRDCAELVASLNTQVVIHPSTVNVAASQQQRLKTNVIGKLACEFEISDQSLIKVSLIGIKGL